MAEITLRYDARNKFAKKTIAYLLSLGLFKKVTGIDKSLEEIKTGKVNTYDSVDDLFKKVLD